MTEERLTPGIGFGVKTIQIDWGWGGVGEGLRVYQVPEMQTQEQHHHQRAICAVRRRQNCITFSDFPTLTTSMMEEQHWWDGETQNTEKLRSARRSCGRW